MSFFFVSGLLFSFGTFLMVAVITPVWKTSVSGNTLLLYTKANISKPMSANENKFGLE